MAALLIRWLAIPALLLSAASAADFLFEERFDDPDLAGRGWYDGTSYRQAGQARSGTGCIEYEWVAPGAKVAGSSTLRHEFAPTDSVYLRFHLKLSPGWGWSGRNYHPHLVHFLTNANGRWDGPAASHLTLYVEPVNAKLRLAAQDIQNQDLPHGLSQGPIKGGYNGTFWEGAEPLFQDDQWHCIEAYFKLNTLDRDQGRPHPDGIVQGWFDGKLVIDRHDVILRTADFPEMKFNQFLVAPYFGPGLLPHPQKLWIDDIAVGTRRPGATPSSPKSP